MQDPKFWVPYLVLISVIVFAIMLQKNNSIYIALKSFFNLHFFKQSVRNENGNIIYLGRILIVNTFLILTLVVFYFLGDILSLIYNVKYEIVFFSILTGIVIWYWLNVILRKLLAEVSSISLVGKEVELYNQFFFQSLGILLLPGVVGLYFFPTDFWGYNFRYFAEITVQLIIIIVFLNKLFQSVFQSFEIKISWFYIFLYICTLEILPLCVGYQLLLG